MHAVYNNGIASYAIEVANENSSCNYTVLLGGHKKLSKKQSVMYSPIAYQIL